MIVGMAVSLMGVEVGWQRLPEGGVEYIIQIAPQELEDFRLEKFIESDIPSRVKNIRRYRIELGTRPLPQDELPPEEPPLPPRTAGSPSPFGRQGGGRSSLLPGRQSDPGSLFAPAVLPSAGDKKAAKDKSGFAEPGPSASRKGDGKSATGRGPAAEPPSKPWVPFVVAVAVLFGSLGGNLYLGWLMWETRRRYRSLLHRQQKGPRKAEEPEGFPEVDDGDLRDTGNR